MADHADVVVVGAGIFGATAALTLRERGHAVTLVDPGPLPHPDASSTDISKVIRADYGSDAFYTERMERALPRWREWNERWDRPLFHETGVLFLTEGPMAEGSFERESHDLLTARGHPLERMDPGLLAARFGAWNAALYGDGYYNPLGGWAESGAVVAACLDEARAAGVAVREERALGLLGDATVTGVRTGETTLSAASVVVAAGAWSASLVPELDGAVRAVGQPVMHFAPRDAAPFRPPRFVPFGADISRTGWYGFCANADGVVKLAHHGPGEVVDPTSPRAIPEGAEARFRSFSSRALPDLAAAPVAHRRLCLYCDSVDGDLWIDNVPGRDGLVIATGGSGHAFKLAPLLGGWVADVVEGGAPEARFAWREVEQARFEQARFVGDG